MAVDSIESLKGSVDYKDIDISHIPQEERPVSKYNLNGAGRFFGLFGGEHVAGTEFVIGATFVSWGVSAFDIFVGLFIGNIFAVLTWALFTAPIAVETRLTLYAYIGKITGTSMQKIFNIANAIFFTINGAAMITVSASAVRVLFDIPVQTGWIPTDIRFVILVLIIGIVCAIISAFGFESVSDFSSVCAPWLAVIFLAGGISGLFFLLQASDSVTAINSFSDFWQLANENVWVSDPASSFSILHVIAYAWIANLTFHGGMSDMATFRFAKKKSYGFISAYGMFFGHFFAWIAAGVFGAAAATVLQTSLTLLDPGAVASTVLGFTGIIAVIIAGWTTSNPSIYRAGLGVQAVFNNYSVKLVTFWVGIFAAVIATSPFVFNYLLEVISLLGTLLLPIGAITVTEHWILPKLGHTRYWSYYQGNKINKPALYSWAISATFVLLMNFTGWLHSFFVFLPTWILASGLYIFLAGKSGSKESYPEEEEREQLLQKKLIKEVDEEARTTNYSVDQIKVSSFKIYLPRYTGYLALATIVVSSFLNYFNIITLDTFFVIALIATLIYFVVATIAQRLERKLQLKEYKIINNIEKEGNRV